MLQPCVGQSRVRPPGGADSAVGARHPAPPSARPTPPAGDVHHEPPHPFLLVGSPMTLGARVDTVLLWELTPAAEGRLKRSGQNEPAPRIVARCTPARILHERDGRGTSSPPRSLPCTTRVTRTSVGVIIHGRFLHESLQQLARKRCTNFRAKSPCTMSGTALFARQTVSGRSCLSPQAPQGRKGLARACPCPFCSNVVEECFAHAWQFHQECLFAWSVSQLVSRAFRARVAASGQRAPEV